MNERDRIEELLREAAADQAELDRLTALLDAVYDGLEKGLSGGVCEEVKLRADGAMDELRRAATELERNIRS